MIDDFPVKTGDFQKYRLFHYKLENVMDCWLIPTYFDATASSEQEPLMNPIRSQRSQIVGFPVGTWQLYQLRSIRVIVPNYMMVMTLSMINESQFFKHEAYRINSACVQDVSLKKKKYSLSS